MIPQAGESYYNAEEKLKANLLQSYSKDVRPSSYHLTPVSVTLGMYLNHFDLVIFTFKSFAIPDLHA